MTETEAKLIEVGNALAHSLGHRLGFNCPKTSHAVPCTCGAAGQQAEALADWDHLTEKLKNA